MSGFGVEFGSADADMKKEKTKTLAHLAFSASDRPQIDGLRKLPESEEVSARSA